MLCTCVAEEALWNVGLCYWYDMYMFVSANSEQVIHVLRATCFLRNVYKFGFLKNKTNNKSD